MSAEERKCNGDVKPEDLSRVGLITYQRKKRPRPSAALRPAEGEVSLLGSDEVKIRDFGWDHGERIDGNRFYWKCNWCGLVRHSGGVSRLKQHLAGGWDVIKCPKVPEHIAKTMNEHLLERKNTLRMPRKARASLVEVNSGWPIQNDLVNKSHGQIDLEMQVRNATQHSKRAAKRFRIDSQRSKTSYPLSRAGTQRCKTDMTKVSLTGSGEVNNRDIGWDHGERIDGNRFYWKCKWCGLVRQSGGVSRLKQHLAGGWDVVKCPKVPKHIAKTMNEHLLERKNTLTMSRKARACLAEVNSEWPNQNDLVGKSYGQIDLETQVRNATQHSKKAAKRFRIDSQRSRTSYPLSRAGTQRCKTNMTKSQQIRKVPNVTMLYGSTYEEDTHALNIIDSHWRSVLEHMLQLPDLSERGGIQSCIHDALISGNSGISRKFKMVDVPNGTAEPKDCYKDHCKVQGLLPRPDISTNATFDVSKTEVRNQDNVNVKTVKCQNVFLDILRSEQFALLCNLLCGNFQDSRAEKLFAFSLINLKMKNGDYELFPGLFDKDIQEVWKKFQILGQEMFLLASRLSTISRASYQQQVRENSVHEACEPEHWDIVDAAEQKNSNYSHTTTQFPCESGHFTKPDQTEASCLYKVCTCKQCGTEADGECSLICDGCEAVYHFSCCKPAIKDIRTRSWYCVSCSKDRRESPEPCEPYNQQDSLHRNCVVCDRRETSETQKDLNESDRTAIPDDSRESSAIPDDSRESSTKPDQTEASCQNKVFTCKQCGAEADGECILICDGCEAVYHFSCCKPATKDIPTQSWYCVSCSKDRRESPEPCELNNQQDGLHRNCIVCDRLEVSETQKDLNESDRTAIPDDSRESSVSSMESEEPPEPSRTALSRLCKQCGTCEDDDKKFITCGKTHCPYKFYHIRCLRSSQIASVQQQNQPCWYCPSCLCRGCLLDKDDDKIALCDGCDEAYHIYCMKPPRTSFPKSPWYCVWCSTAKQLILQQHGKDADKSSEIRPMDVLLRAVDELSEEDQLALGMKDK